MAQELVLEHAYIDERGRQFKGFVMGDEMLMSKSSRIITSKIQPKIIINPPLKSVREHRVIKNDYSTITYNSRNPYEKQIQGKSLTHRYKETTSKSGKSIIVPIHKPTELSNVSSSKSTLTEQMIPKSNKVYKNIVYAINGNLWQRINDKGKLSGLKSIYSMTASSQSEREETIQEGYRRITKDVEKLRRRQEKLPSSKYASTEEILKEKKEMLRAYKTKIYDEVIEAAKQGDVEALGEAVEKL